MRTPRQLTSEERALWRKVAETVAPLEKRRPVPDARADPKQAATEPERESASSPKLQLPERMEGNPGRSAMHRVGPPPRATEVKVGLDASWERRILRGGLEPDFSLDLHGATLEQAYARLIHGLAQAKAMGARVVLIVTGKPRTVEAADRSERRGAIRAKIADWLGASEHARDIAAVRGAHRRHGGQGALYVVLKRRR